MQSFIPDYWGTVFSQPPNIMPYGGGGGYTSECICVHTLVDGSLVPRPSAFEFRTASDKRAGPGNEAKLMV